MRRLSRRGAIVSAARQPEPGASTGTIVQTLGPLTQDASGSSLTSVTGTAAQTLPALTQTALGDVDDPPVTGTIVQTLPALTQTATAPASPQPAYFQTDQYPVVGNLDDADQPAYFQTDQFIEDV